MITDARTDSPITECLRHRFNGDWGIKKQKKLSTSLVKKAAVREWHGNEYRGNTERKEARYYGGNG